MREERWLRENVTRKMVSGPGPKKVATDTEKILRALRLEIKWRPAQGSGYKGRMSPSQSNMCKEQPLGTSYQACAGNVDLHVHADMHMGLRHESRFSLAKCSQYNFRGKHFSCGLEPGPSLFKKSALQIYGLRNLSDKGSDKG